MTYCVPNDVREAVAPDGSVVGTCGELNDEQLQRAIQRGQDLVDATTGYTYPDDNAPSLVVGLALSLATYYATLAYRKGKELANTHPIYLMYVDARTTLTQIKQGLLDTTPPADTTNPPVRAGSSLFQPHGTDGLPMFLLQDLGLRRKEGGPGPPTIDPELEAWGMI
jgi:hypothetical protein